MVLCHFAGRGKVKAVPNNQNYESSKSLRESQHVRQIRNGNERQQIAGELDSVEGGNILRQPFVKGPLAQFGLDRFQAGPASAFRRRTMN